MKTAPGKGQISQKKKGFPGEKGGFFEGGFFFLSFEMGRALPSRAAAPAGLQSGSPRCCAPRSYAGDGAKGMCGARGAEGRRARPSDVPGVFQIYSFQSSAAFRTKGWNSHRISAEEK